MEQRFYLSWRANEKRLIRELSAVFPHSMHTMHLPGVISSRIAKNEAALSRQVVFSRQVLPNAEPVTADSITNWARKVVDRVSAEIEAGPWMLHLYPVGLGYTKADQRRCALITNAVTELLKRQRRDLFRSLTQTGDERKGSLVQCLLFDPSHGAISVCPPRDRDLFHATLAPVPGGLFQVPEDKAPPSRAYRKLVEALALASMEIRRGETVVDLGASPGSWTAVALSAGAVVTAVDRAALTAELMKHNRLTFVKGDGFRYRPDQAVDWLLCDIIAYPERSIALLTSWLDARLCKNFCVTVKFKGDISFELLDRLKDAIQSRTKHVLLRQLYSNKNELTAIGAAPIQPTI